MRYRRVLLVGMILIGVAGFFGPFSGLGASQGAGAKLLIPDKSWNCGMPEGIPGPEGGALIFEAAMKLDKVLDVGKTPFGQRQAIVVRDGAVSGSKLAGSVLPGALDFQLKLSNGVIEIEQLLVLKTSDGTNIFVRTAGTGADESDVRIVADFEAPGSSAAAWLNSGKYVGRRLVNAASKTMTLRIYDVSDVTAAPGAANSFRIVKPSDAPAQPWEYRKAGPSEKPGSQLITENVTLGPSVSVGASKRGNRNIIPITGGILSGRISGTVVSGGADYQNLSAPATIDARYLWQTAEGEIIIVRNAGQFGGLVPTFEVRTDSPYAWLNKGLYLSSNPGVGAGGVSITMTESSN